jgi:curved DNA-binding protein CbpA
VPTNFSELEGHDAYELLGVGTDASQQDIRLAYRALARSHHPDLFSGQAEKDEAEERIRLLNAARDVLKNHRSAYDAFRCADDVEEPANYEIIDDPWDTAEAGAPPPKPAPTVDSGAPRPAPTWSPTDNRPTPSPRYEYSPRARPHGSPMRLRDHQWRRPIGCVMVIGAIIVVSALIDLFSTSGPKPSASVPNSLAGTWKGTVSEKSGRGNKSTWSVQITLHAGKHNGDVDYFDGKCTGTAVPVSYKAGKLTVSTEFSKALKSCDVGDFELALKHHPRLAITYRDHNGKVASSGILTAD